MFRELIPRLADQFRLIAPDLPGFGFTTVPETRAYLYSFDALAHTLEAFTDALGLKRYAIYVFDYGAPTGFRLAMNRPDESPRSFHKMAMLMKKVSATRGRPSGSTGLNRPKKTEK